MIVFFGLKTCIPEVYCIFPTTKSYILYRWMLQAACRYLWFCLDRELGLGYYSDKNGVYTDNNLLKVYWMEIKQQRKLDWQTSLWHSRFCVNLVSMLYLSELVDTGCHLFQTSIDGEEFVLHRCTA